MATDTPPSYSNAYLVRLADIDEPEEREKAFLSISEQLDLFDAYFMLNEMKNKHPDNKLNHSLQLLVKAFFLEKYEEVYSHYQRSGKSFLEETRRELSKAKDLYLVTGVFNFHPEYLKKSISCLPTSNDSIVQQFVLWFFNDCAKLEKLKSIQASEDVEGNKEIRSFTPITWNGTATQLGYLIQQLQDAKLIPEDSPKWAWAQNAFVQSNGKPVKNLAQAMNNLLEYSTTQKPKKPEVIESIVENTSKHD